MNAVRAERQPVERLAQRADPPGDSEQRKRFGGDVNPFHRRLRRQHAQAEDGARAERPQANDLRRPARCGHIAGTHEIGDQTLPRERESVEKKGR